MIGWGLLDGPFGQNINLFITREPYMRESSRRRQIFDGRGDHKRSAEFLELRDCVYKGTQGPVRHYGS